MRHIFLSLFFSFFFSFCIAQNLVPNPSFEDTLECPDFPGQVWRAEGWYVASATPDYYHCCSNETHPVCGVPHNIFSSRYAGTGNAYCGLWVYINSNPPEGFQEKVGVQLLSEMEIGVKYYVSMKVSSVSSNKDEPVNGGINKLGMFFSTIKYDLNKLPPNNNYSHFSNDFIIDDTTGWITIKGDFVADSAYKFLSIGNFYKNDQINSLRYWYLYNDTNNKGITAYYFIDDICVTTDSNGCDFSSITPEVCNNTNVSHLESSKVLKLYPNPVDDFLSIKTDLITNGFFEISSISGQILLKEELHPGIYTTIKAVYEFVSGIYYVKLYTSNQITIRKLIIQH